jgi:TRAP transporter TAXI family solute receptor
MRNQKKSFWLVLVIISLTMLIITPQVRAGKIKHFSMVSASPGGNWYTMVGAAVTLYTKKLPGTKFTIAGTGGSVANARRFVSGEADLGPIYSSNLYEMYHSVGTFKGRPPSDAAQVLCQIYDSPHYFVTLKGSGIKSISDLAGKRVAYGPPGSGTSQNSKLTFKTLGIKVKGTELAFGDAARQLGDGKIDALGQGGAPASGIVELVASHDIEFVQFTPKELDKMISLAPYYFKGELPKNTYEGQDKAVPTFLVAVFLAAHKSFPADAAYEVLKATFSPEGQTFLGNAHRYWKKVGHNPAGVKQLGVKYHPGAIRYWKEHGR